jgi:hypothetical protein
MTIDIPPGSSLGLMRCWGIGVCNGSFCFRGLFGEFVVVGGCCFLGFLLVLF